MKLVNEICLAVVLLLMMGNIIAAAAELTQENYPDYEEGQSSPVATISDPIEPWNRAMFQFNDRLYFWVMKPVARGYSFLVPEPGRVAVHHVYDNVRAPIRITNNFLQFKMKQSGIELVRFIINTTFGIGGIWDAAECYGLKPCHENLGQTLGYYGLGYGFYIVWPFLGPSSVRDTVGFSGDAFLNPLNYIDPLYVPYAVEAYRVENEVSLHIGDYETIIQAALDPYVAIRDAYVQHRNKEIGE